MARELHLFGSFIDGCRPRPEIQAVFRNFASHQRVYEEARNSAGPRGSEPAAPTPSMIFSAIILSLLSLLVATDPEPAGASVPAPPEPPLQPLRKSSSVKDDQQQPEQIAA